MKKLKKIGVALLAVGLSLSFAACGSTSYDSYESSAEYYASSTTSGFANDEGTYTAAKSEESTEAESYDDSARKLITTYNLTVETEEFESFMEMVQSKVSQLGGYIENLDEYNGSSYSSYRSSRYAYLTVRIPTAQAESFLGVVGDNANITNQTVSVEDITLTYVDLESRKSSYETEQKRLLELLEQAESLEDILTIEERLTTIRYQLESMESQLRTYDNLVDYTTIYLDINEVTAYTEPEPESYGERLLKSFTSGLEEEVEDLGDFVVGFVGALPSLIVFVIVVLIIFFIVRAIVKKNKKKKAQKAQQAVYATPVMPVVNATPSNSGEETKNDGE